MHLQFKKFLSFLIAGFFFCYSNLSLSVLDFSVDPVGGSTGIRVTVHYNDEGVSGDLHTALKASLRDKIDFPAVTHIKFVRKGSGEHAAFWTMCEHVSLLMPNILSLDVSENSLDPLDIMPITEHFPNIQILSVRDNPILDKGVWEICALKDLRILDISRCGVIGGEELNRLPKGLESLAVDGNPFGICGLKPIENLSHLEFFSYQGGNLFYPKKEVREESNERYEINGRYGISERHEINRPPKPMVRWTFLRILPTLYPKELRYLNLSNPFCDRGSKLSIAQKSSGFPHMPYMWKGNWRIPESIEGESITIASKNPELIIVDDCLIAEITLLQGVSLMVTQAAQERDVKYQQMADILIFPMLGIIVEHTKSTFRKKRFI